MPLRIYNNLFSLNAQRHLGNNSSQLGKSLERLSSGMRINHAGDDAAGLAISEQLRADLRSISQALRNTNDGISMINVAEGGLTEQTSILVRMRELATQAATGTIGSIERRTIDREFSALKAEMDRISLVTEFNGQKLLDGSMGANSPQSVVIQIGIQATANDRISLNSAVDLTNVDSAALGLATADTLNVTNALSALTIIDSAISMVTQSRGKLGAVQNRLEHTVTNLNISFENLQAAEAQIRDADYAHEISMFTRNQILVQASTAILAQANLVPQSVLQLLG